MIKEMKFPMRKKLSALLAAALAVSMLTLPAGAVSQSTALETMRALGIMAGDSQGNLNLSSAVTRAEFVTMMTAASSYKDTVGSGYGVSLFKDVKSSHWASEYIRLHRPAAPAGLRLLQSGRVLPHRPAVQGRVCGPAG